MRQIKFRAWDDRNKIMIENIPVSNGHGMTWKRAPESSYVVSIESVNGKVNCYSDWDFLKEDPSLILMQYTGLKDTTSGVEIYEGDLVPYMDDFLQVIIEADGVWFENDEVTLRYDDFKDKGLEIEVIGNIHQNPELLTGRISK